MSKRNIYFRKKPSSATTPLSKKGISGSCGRSNRQLCHLVRWDSEVRTYKEERNKTRMEERQKQDKSQESIKKKMLLSWYSSFCLGFLVSFLLLHSHNCLDRVSKVVGRFDILKALPIEQCLQHIELYIEPCIDIKISRAF